MHKTKIYSRLIKDKGNQSIPLWKTMNSSGTTAVFNLRLIVPHYWGKTILCTLPDACDSWGFPHLLMEMGIFIHFLWAQGTVTSNPFRQFFILPWGLSTHMCWSVLSWIENGDPTQISGVLSVQLSPLHYFALWTTPPLLSWTLSSTSSI